MTARVCVLGPSGRMGRAVLEAATDRRDLEVCSAVDRQSALVIGTQVAPNVIAIGDLAQGLAGCDVYVDFTSPDGTRAAAEAAVARGEAPPATGSMTRGARRGHVPAAVIGTTGLGEPEERAIAELARVAPVVIAANFSLGVNLVLGLVRQAAKALGPEWDAEVVETHHRAKRDAPSGTALAIARAIAAGHGVEYDQVKRHTRDGDVGARPHGEIGVASVRGGDVVGEHVAYFFGAAERIEIAHRATSRTIFAAGALKAAAWVVGKPPGRYDMLDVLGFAGP